MTLCLLPQPTTQDRDTAGTLGFGQILSDADYRRIREIALKKFLNTPEVCKDA